MTGGEDETEKVITNRIIDCFIEPIDRGFVVGLEIDGEFLVFALESNIASDAIDRAILPSGHEPGTRVRRNTGLRPLLECGEERVVREIFGRTNVTDDPGESGNYPRRFDPPDRVNRTVNVRPHPFRSVSS
jgi:hypothetical protein